MPKTRRQRKIQKGGNFYPGQSVKVKLTGDIVTITEIKRDAFGQILYVVTPRTSAIFERTYLASEIEPVIPFGGYPSGYSVGSYSAPAPGGFGFTATGFGAAASPVGGISYAAAAPSEFGAASNVPDSRFNIGDTVIIPKTHELVIIKEKKYSHDEWGYGVVDKSTPKGNIGWVYESDLEDYTENNNNADGVIRYVISSHGRPSKASYSPPQNFRLAFFTNDGRVLNCPNVMQTVACLGTQDYKVKEWVNSSRSTKDYLLSKDTDVTWKSGAVDCATKRVVFSLEEYKAESEVPLSRVMRNIEEYHYSIYGDVPAIVYCLFCRGGGAVNYVKPGGPRGRRATHKARKSRTSRKSRR